MKLPYFTLSILPITKFLPATLAASPSKFYGAKSVYQELLKLHHSEDYGHYTSLSSAQKEFDLSTVGGGDCSSDDKDECDNWIFQISRHEQHSIKFATLPSVLLMAGMDGADAMGATALVEAARLILEGIACEEGIATVKMDKCPMDDLEKNPQAISTSLWLAQLASSRRIIIIPAMGTEGSSKGKRPAFDFPVEGDDGSCLETIEARTVNEVFRKNAIQLSLSFRSVGKTNNKYPGHHFPRLANTNKQLAQGDEAGWEALMKGLDIYASATHDDYNDYTLGQYYDKGGMENWSYHGSWDDKLPICTGNDKKYALDKSIYNDAMLRNIGFAVETPLVRVDGDINDRQTKELERCMRYAFMTIEMVQPYVTIHQVGDRYTYMPRFKSGSDDGYVGNENKKCMTEDIHIPVHVGDEKNVGWSVGGAFTVDSTYLVYGDLDSFPASFGCGNGEQPTPEDARLLSYLAETKVIHSSKLQTGITDLMPVDQYDGLDFDGITPPSAKNFQEELDLSSWKDGDQIAMFIVATVDHDWASTTDDTAQSHFVNARTNSKWSKQNGNNAEVQGHAMWFSEPVKIVVGDATSADTFPGDAVASHSANSKATSKSWSNDQNSSGSDGSVSNYYDDTVNDESSSKSAVNDYWESSSSKSNDQKSYSNDQNSSGSNEPVSEYFDDTVNDKSSSNSEMNDDLPNSSSSESSSSKSVKDDDWSDDEDWSEDDLGEGAKASLFPFVIIAGLGFLYYRHQKDQIAGQRPVQNRNNYNWMAKQQESEMDFMKEVSDHQGGHNRGIYANV